MAHRLSIFGSSEESGLDWCVLSQSWPAARSSPWLRNKWWALKHRLGSAQALSLRGEIFGACGRRVNMGLLSRVVESEDFLGFWLHQFWKTDFRLQLKTGDSTDSYSTTLLLSILIASGQVTVTLTFTSDSSQR